MSDEYDEFGGEVVKNVRDDITAYFQDRGVFDTMYDFPEPVISRSGGKIVVAYQDTWFLRYNDAEWKEKACQALERLDAIPETTRGQLDHTIDWLEEWPCIRNYGLGTPLPWDDEFIIEPLSDSTIQMAYFTIAHRLERIPPEDLDTDFFDTLFYGSTAVDEPDERALELRTEWDYWYPVTYRYSANDLISNHLLFYLFHHAELFDESKWPQGITTMGMGLLDGSKMSSTKGNVILPDEAIETYGADTVRLFLLNAAEPWQDYDWRAEQVASTRNQLEQFWTHAQEVIDAGAGECTLEHIDRWLLSKLQETIEGVTEAMERCETRTASQRAFHQFKEHLTWYRRRTTLDRPGARWTLRTVLETRLRLLAPIVPFLTNELHEQLTGTPAEDRPWPTVDESFVDSSIETEERLVKTLSDDIAKIIDVTGTDPTTISVYTAINWKQEVFDTILEIGPDHGAAMGEVMQDKAIRQRGNAVNDLVGDLVEIVRGRTDEELADLRSINEHAIYEHASAFLAREFDAAIEMASETDAEATTADQAMPLRPAIHIE